MPSNTNNPDLLSDEKENSIEYFMNMEVILPSTRRYGSYLCQVCGLAHNDWMQTSSGFNNNPYLNTQVFNIEFPNGNVEQYTAIIIAQNFYKTCDDEGYCWLTVVDTVGHN